MEGATPGRTVLFVVVSAVLVASAIAFRDPPEPSEPGRPTGTTDSNATADSTSVIGVAGTGGMARAGGGASGAGGGRSNPELVDELQRQKSEVEAAARRFLVAFLRYEVGELTPAVRRALRTSTTAGFARRLLRHPPRPVAAGDFPPQAELRTVEVAFLSPRATRAVVSGMAQRGGLPEEFSFVFSRRGASWLASGPGE